MVAAPVADSWDELEQHTRQLEPSSLDSLVLIAGSLLKAAQVHPVEPFNVSACFGQGSPEGQLALDTEAQGFHGLEFVQRSACGVVNLQLETGELFADPRASLAPAGFVGPGASDDQLKGLLILSHLDTYIREQPLCLGIWRSLNKVVEQVDGADRSGEVIVEVGGQGSMIHRALGLGRKWPR
jgi:hypothetical protein